MAPVLSLTCLMTSGTFDLSPVAQRCCGCKLPAFGQLTAEYELQPLKNRSLNRSCI